MPRKTKIEIELERRIDRACQNACSGLSIPILKLSEITNAAKTAAANGGDIEAAARAKAQELHSFSKVG